MQSLRKPIPLVVIGGMHPSCVYKWSCLEEPDEFPNTPVLFVRKPLIFVCTVSVNGKEMFKAHFDVVHNPTSG